jgi:O-antigen ligase
MQVRMLAGGGEELRVNLTRDTLRMAADRPVWGWGLGSYAIVFPSYQGDYLRDTKGAITARVVHAHNDWAHIAAETGLIGLLILGTPVLVLIIRCRRGESALLRWGGGGTVVLLVYALADFPLHCPAVLLLWTTVLCTSAPHVALPGTKKPRRLSQVSRAKMAARVGVEPATK